MNDIEALMSEMVPHIALAVPRHVTANRMARVMESALCLNPKLARLERVRSCILQAAQLGLEPGVLDHCYLIPRGKECTLLLGYEGMIELMHRSGLVRSIKTKCVYKGEPFEHEEGTESKLVHTPKQKLRGNSDNIIAAYIVITRTDGSKEFEVLYRDQIDKRRGRGGANSKAWGQDYDAMARKSCVREAWKWVPKTAEVQNMGLEVVPEPAIDVESVVVDLPDEPAPRALPERTAAQSNHHKLIDLCTKAGISVDAYNRHRKDRIKEHGRRCTEARQQGVPQPPAPANQSPALVATILESRQADQRPENQILGIKDGVLTAELSDLLEGKRLDEMNREHLLQLWTWLETQPKFTKLRDLVCTQGKEAAAKEAQNGNEKQQPASSPNPGQ